nr:NAD(P)H-dependent oxidoreductase [Candidatus Gracilibacteria bacterium]
LVEWADVVVVATPIRWGAASSLYYTMQERLNCLQNQLTLNNKVLIKDKAACFVITGGQDNVQAVAGQLLTFFSEIGFHLPPFAFVGWSRGWTNEDMATNFADLQKSTLVDDARVLVQRSVDLVQSVRKR